VKKVMVVIIASLILIAGCSSTINGDTTSDIITSIEQTSSISENQDDNSTIESESKIESTVSDSNPEETKNQFDRIDLALKPNEAGKVMILMFHSIGDNNNAWEITPEVFRENLEYLYKNKYRPISLNDFINGYIDLSAGFTPFIITFDDANKNNFNVIVENNEIKIDPLSAMGIMEELNNKCDDFNITATFFIFGINPFRQMEYIQYKFDFLVANGYDIGNHTYNHPHLNKLTTIEEIQSEIGRENNFFKGILPNYVVNTFSIPFGENPPEELNKYLFDGEFDSVKYNNITALEVGWYPSYSIFDKRFDRSSVPRIRVSSTTETSESEEWFLYFEEKPQLKFISDGNPDIITFPKEMEEFINEDIFKDKKIYSY